MELVNMAKGARLQRKNIHSRMAKYENPQDKEYGCGQETGYPFGDDKAALWFCQLKRHKLDTRFHKATRLVSDLSAKHYE